ncbi:MAG: putative nucleotide-diphospho-sugar transferase, partial [Bacteroidota bacterium]
MALQVDVGQNCAGFFICRANDRTITLFRTIRKRLGRFSNDQMALNHYLHAQKVPFKKFDGRVYTVGQTIHKRWEGEPVKVPDNIIVHHANYTVGVNNKIKLMNMVRNQVAPKKRQRVKA